MKRKFVIVDPGLSHLGSHNHPIAQNFSQGAQSMGYEVLWFCHTNLPAKLVPQYIRHEGVFSLSYYRHHGISKAHRRMIRVYTAIAKNIESTLLHAHLPINKNQQLHPWLWANPLCLRMFPFTRELVSALKRHNVRPTDHVFLTTAEYLQYQAVLSLFLLNGHERLPFFHIRTSFDESEKINRKYGCSLPWLFHAFSRLGIVEARVFFYAENPSLADHFNGWGLLPFEVLENPPPRHARDRDMASLIQGSDKPFTILCPGASRPEKGYHRLPHIVSALGKRTDISKKYRFVVQSNSTRSNQDLNSACAAARDRLKQLSDGTVELVEEVLPDEQYYALIADADLILLPYDREKYRIRPSGIALEAALLAKPMVVTRGSTLAALAEPDFGGVAGTVDEFAEQLAKVINAYDTYKSRALARAEKLCCALDAPVLVQRMVNRAEKSTSRSCVLNDPCCAAASDCRAST